MTADQTKDEIVAELQRKTCEIQKSVAAGIALTDAEGWDIESAHIQEDQMLWEFVQLIAKMGPEGAADAIAAAKDLAEWNAKNEKRRRWYA